MAALAAAVVAAPALAAGTFYGQWDVTACASGRSAALVITPLALRWHDTSCTVRRSYRVGNSWHISTACLDAASELAVTLQLNGDRLQVEWNGVKMALRRCS